MPELPEVEVSRLGLIPHIVGKTIREVIFRTPKLRHDLTPTLLRYITGRTIQRIERRGKYLLFDCECTQGGGWLLIHLGMSGSLRFVAPKTPPQKHDHVDLIFNDTTLRFRDPRRFGTLQWSEGSNVLQHPLLRSLGIEPLTHEFDGAHLHTLLHKRHAPIKTVIMDAHCIVGVGNIYAAESLFKAGIAPTRPAHELTLEQCNLLVAAIKETLSESISAGGSSVRDYVHSDGGAGAYQLACAVYGRHKLPCVRCGASVALIKQAGRSTFFCPHCQQ